MNTVYILSGLPGSGKSYWSNNYIKNNPSSAIIVNLDKIREMLVGEYQNFPFSSGGKYLTSLNKVLGTIKEESIIKAVDSELDIIIDETHITKKARSRSKLLLNSAVQCGLDNNAEYKIVIVYFTENTNNLKYRMETPKGGSESMWRNVIESMKSSFQIPSEDECDELIIVEGRE